MRNKTRLVAALVAALLIIGCMLFSGSAQAVTGQNMFGTGSSGINTDPDTSANSVIGTQFTVANAGTVDAVKIYRTSKVTGAVTGKLAQGSTVLSTVTLPAAGAGWQTVNLPSSVNVTTGKTYTVYYTAPKGRYAVHSQYTWPHVSGDLTAVKGVYTYGTGVPTLVYQNENYYADVVFNPTAAPTTSASPTPTTTADPSTTTVTPTTSASPTESSTTTAAPPNGCAAGLSTPGSADPFGGCYPGADNTGVPAGTTLTPYTGPCTITAANTVIDAQTVNCDLSIQAAGVKITRSKINGIVSVDSESTGYSMTITDSEVDAGNVFRSGIGDINFTATRVEVVGGNRSIMCFKDCTVEDSYVHGQLHDQTGVAHESGIRMGSGSTIRHNTVVCDAPNIPPDAGCSADLTGYGDFAPVQNNLIERNLFKETLSGGYCVYGGDSPTKPFPQSSGIRFIDNMFEKGVLPKDRPYNFCAWYGAVSNFDSGAPGNVWQGNRYDDGTPLTL